jgi:hypothetical protein
MIDHFVRRAHPRKDDEESLRENPGPVSTCLLFLFSDDGPGFTHEVITVPCAERYFFVAGQHQR